MKFKKVLLFLITISLFTQYGCKKDSVENSNCNLEPDPGPCEGLFIKYYFDKDEDKCKEFSWGGCEGTVPFDTFEECEECQ